MGRRVQQQTPGGEVLVDNLALMQLCQDGRELDGQREEGVKVWPVRGPQCLEGCPTRILMHQATPAVVMQKLLDPHDSRQRESLEEGVFLCEQPPLD